MHPQLCHELLAEQVAVVNDGHLARRLRGPLELVGTRVLARIAQGDRRWILAFDGPNYDAEPLSLSVLDPDSRAPLSEGDWPPTLRFGSPHPTLGGPFACLRGLREYHLHPSHLEDPWDRHRYALRLDVLLRHVLAKAAIDA